MTTKNWHITAGVRLQGFAPAMPTATAARARAPMNASVVRAIPLEVSYDLPLAVAAAENPVATIIPTASTRWTPAARRSVAGPGAGAGAADVRLAGFVIPYAPFTRGADTAPA